MQTYELDLKVNPHKAYKALGGVVFLRAFRESNLGNKIVFWKKSAMLQAKAYELDPMNDVYRQELAQTYYELGSSLYKKSVNASNLSYKILSQIDCVNSYLKAYELVPEGVHYATSMHDAYKMLVDSLFSKAFRESDVSKKIVIVKEIIEIHLKAHNLAPENDIYKTGLHQAYYILGDLLYDKVLAEPDLSKKIILQKEAVAALLEAHNLAPENDIYKADLHDAYNNLGASLCKKVLVESDLSEQIVLQKEAVDAFLEAHHLAPENEMYKRNLPHAYDNLGVLLYRKALEESDLSKKIILQKESVDAHFNAHNLAPEHDMCKRNLYKEYNNLGVLLRNKVLEESDLSKKIILQKEAVGAFLKAHNLAPENDMYKRNLHKEYNNLGVSLCNKVLEESDLSKKIVLQKEAVGAFLKAHNLAPENDIYKTGLHEAYYILGDLLYEKVLAEPDLSEKIVLGKEAVDVLLKAYHLDPENDIYKTGLCQAYNALGYSLYKKSFAASNLSEKIAIMKESVEVFLKAGDLAPENDIYKTNLYQTSNTLGALLCDKVLAEPDLSEKIALQKEAVDAFLEARDIAPENDEDNRSLHCACNNLGVLLHRKALAAPDLSEKIALMKEVVNAFLNACGLAFENDLYNRNFHHAYDALQVLLENIATQTSVSEDSAVLSGNLSDDQDDQEIEV